MKIKTLSMAAILAVGLATGGLTSAMAQCPCNEAINPQPAQEYQTQKSCQKCKRPVSDCKCKKDKKKACNNRKDKKRACEKQEDLNCKLPKAPTCASCASAQEATRAEMHQKYAYPNAIYGTNNYVGENANSITTSETLGSSTLMSRETNGISGVTVSTDRVTGAASPILGEDFESFNSKYEYQESQSNLENPISISTQNSLKAIKKSYEAIDIEDGPTGAAANLEGAFPDVPNSYWAACDINKLAMNDVIVGYPDSTFKPRKDVSRAEFATMLVKGFNLDSCLEHTAKFSDVPKNHWANSLIAKAVASNFMKGYPNGTFKPNAPVTRAEALCAISKGITCDIDQCKAQEVLSQYKDANRLPSWAQIPIAKAIESGALKDSQNNNMIMPNKEATRADIASMLQTVRVAAGYDTNPVTANDDCPMETQEKAYLEHEQLVQIPTLKLEFLDQVTAKSSHVGDRFAAKTLEDVTINGVLYPCGSKVIGKIVEVVRPSGSQKGALKLAFTEIQHDGCKAELPKQILNAQINKVRTPNPVARLITMPFTWTGSLIGVVGRTAGGMLSNVGNAAENITNNVGIAMGETFQGQFMAAGRSTVGAVGETLKAPIDVTRTVLSGTMGLFQTTGDEVAYLVDPKGYKISAVNPREHITIAFGCPQGR